MYAPPEWILHETCRGDESTVWSLGVLLFNMIYGDIPFEHDSDIVNCNLDFNKYANLNAQTANYYTNTSHYTATTATSQSDVRDLIRRCLRRNADDRIKLENILSHSWFAANN